MRYRRLRVLLTFVHEMHRDQEHRLSELFKPLVIRQVPNLSAVSLRKLCLFEELLHFFLRQVSSVLLIKSVEDLQVLRLIFWSEIPHGLLLGFSKANSLRRHQCGQLRLSGSEPLREVKLVKARQTVCDLMLDLRLHRRLGYLS